MAAHRDNNTLRNIFDQYTHHENRLTHALVSALAADLKLLRKFVKWITGTVPAKRLNIVEQQLPGEYELSEQEYEQRGLPDAWIYDDELWSLLIESKVSAELNRGQLERHFRTARKRGFEKVTVLAIDVEKPLQKLPNYVVFKSWKDIYGWLCQQSANSEWAKHTLMYMEVAETKWPIEGYLKEGTLTKFSGIHFDDNNPYNYPEGKRLIRLIMEELQSDPNLKDFVNFKAGGRDAITGKGRSSVWDYRRLRAFPFKVPHTSQPHLSMLIAQDAVRAFLEIPNSVSTRYRKPIKKLEEDGFREKMLAVNKNMGPVLRSANGAFPYASVSQRRFPTRSSKPILDGTMMFDLRTAFKGGKRQSVKEQAEWLSAMYALMTNKKSYLEFSIGVSFPYESCNKVKSATILDALAESWLACGPLVDVMTKSKLS